MQFPPDVATSSLPLPGRIAFGGDYNPEQWSPDVWLEDIRLMREAQVTMVTVGVFAWGALEPREGEFHFEWLDQILDLLNDAGIAVALATPTAAPPIWLHQQHPDLLPVDDRGIPYAQGGRLGWCPSNPVWRRHSLAIAERLARRYAAHPAVRMWHIGNEFGGGNRLCFCGHSASAFQAWLRDRYLTVDALNAAWRSTVWGLVYPDFGSVLPPRDSESPGNPGLILDFARFSSDALLAQYTAERDTIARFTQNTPITTNFMVGHDPHVVDYTAWAREVDVRANDHYTFGDDPHRAQDIAYSGDRMRGLGRATPWLLMENAAGAVSWQQRNLAKAPGEMIRNAVAHVARGADGVLFFQWRQSIGGPEQFHSGLVPHAGTDSRQWREVVLLGELLDKAAPLQGTLTEPARVAIVVDDVSVWAWGAGPKPIHGFPIGQIAREHHRAFWRRNVLADVISPAAALDDYDLIIVPALFATNDEFPARLQERVAEGAHAVITFLSGIVDEANLVRTGGYPGAFRELLGARATEFQPLTAGTSVELDEFGDAIDWTEDVDAFDAETVARYADGPLAGSAAITTRIVGAGRATYVSARLDERPLQRFIDRLIADAALEPPIRVADGVEVTRRIGGPDGSSHLIAINHTEQDQLVPSPGRNLLTGATADAFVIPAGGAAIIEELGR